jgi:hypothetical protein
MVPANVPLRILSTTRRNPIPFPAYIDEADSQFEEGSREGRSLKSMAVIPLLICVTPLALGGRQGLLRPRKLGLAERETIIEALQVATTMHDGQKRRDGQPFITHPLAVAQIMRRWRMDATCITAALLHDTVEDTPLTFAEVERDFGAEVRRLVEGVTRQSKLTATPASADTELQVSSSLASRRPIHDMSLPDTAVPRAGRATSA